MQEIDGTILRSVPDIRPLYILPDDPFAAEVLIPCFKSSSQVDCMMGFFSSEVLVPLAPGLATFISCSQESFRLVISPLLRAEDRTAIEKGLPPPEEIARSVLDAIVVTEDLIEQHTLRCLSWLLRHRRVEIKVALMKKALFHPKVWLFRASDDLIAVHGSSNMTYAGIQKNIEQISVAKSWMNPTQEYTTDRFSQQFRRLWNNQDDNCIVIPIPQAIRDRLLQTYRSDTLPTEADLRKLYSRAVATVTESPVTYETLELNHQCFAIPPTLQYDEGPFEHQGTAVNAWCEAGYRGVLEMATGSGKTITAMICAHRLYDEHKPLLIVIAAPFVPLIQQWCDEILPFGIKAINLTAAAGARGRAKELAKIRRRLRSGSRDVTAVVVSHRTLCDSGFKCEIEEIDSTTLLIADEVHNLGSEGFTSDLPTFFDYRLGLSATPIRQYDEEGTQTIFSFFGDVVFRFTLEEAIGRCLVEYDYFVHPVELTQDEMDEWYNLTEKIKTQAWRQENEAANEYLTKLLRDRRSILENAENKPAALEAVLMREDLRTLRHTLIYTSDKAPEQLEAVNALLNKRGVLFHQLTYEETASRNRTADIIASFQEGTLRILTAKRVLDEGVNIPQIEKAFILASTTVERQWIQRRGRLLRTCHETSKTHSEIHDFIALPPDMDNIDDETRTLIRSEFSRVREFASLARNAGRASGPLSVIDRLARTIYL